MSCYCGLPKPFQSCCQPIIDGIKVADTPEKLMRSRYSAYATVASDYLFNTTALSNQVNISIEQIQQWAKQTHWIKLTIEAADKSSLTNYDSNAWPTVQFTALYIYQNRLCQLTERSVFIIEQQQWKYLSGNILVDEQISTLKRNQPCPCGSQKKYKRCCIKPGF